MHDYDWLLLAAFSLLVLAPAPFLGRYFYRVMEGQRTWLSPLLQPVERLCYRVAGVDPQQEQSWRGYALALLAFTLVCLLALMSILLLQGGLPLNPQQVAGLSLPLAFNTAVSFVTNTNWQAYSGEAQLSYFSQMLGLGVQNFVSPAVGLAVLVVLCRGLERQSSDRLGNFWVDITRAVLYGLLPLCLVLAVLLVWQGVPQNFSDYVSATTLQGSEQTLPMGPAASQIAIKQLGTNGGGFFGVNSAHPFENPTALSNLLELVSILLIPAALVFTSAITCVNCARVGRSSPACWCCSSSAWVSAPGRSYSRTRRWRGCPSNRSVRWRARRRASAASPRCSGPRPPRRRPTAR